MNVQTVNIDAAVEGMVPARDLCDGSGVLLPQGATLTEIALRSLRRRGIEACEVVVDEAAPDPAALAAERARRCQRLAQVFRHSATLEATPQLFERLRQFRCEDDA